MMHLEQLPATPMLEAGSMCIGPLSAALSRFVVEGGEMKITSVFFLFNVAREKNAGLSFPSLFLQRCLMSVCSVSEFCIRMLGR